MHEASLCDALFDQVDAALAPHRDAGAVVRVVRVAIGELAGVDPELFRLAFEALGADRHARAALELRHVAAVWRCPTCADDGDRAAARAPDAPLRCPACTGPLALAAGDELVLERVELELPEEAPHV